MLDTFQPLLYFSPTKNTFTLRIPLKNPI